MYLQTLSLFTLRSRKPCPKPLPAPVSGDIHCQSKEHQNKWHTQNTTSDLILPLHLSCGIGFFVLLRLHSIGSFKWTYIDQSAQIKLLDPFIPVSISVPTSIRIVKGYSRLESYSELWWCANPCDFFSHLLVSNGSPAVTNGSLFQNSVSISLCLPLSLSLCE